MPDWTAFAGFAGVVLALLLLLARASQSVITDAERRPTRPESDGAPAATASDPTALPPDAWEWGVTDDENDTSASVATALSRETGTAVSERVAPLDVSTSVLLANVAASQGLFGLLLLGAAWYTEVPASAFGATPTAVAPSMLLVGTVVGVALYGANELGARLVKHLGLGGADDLREALAPDSLAGWAVLLLVVLPMIAGFEELLFRGALIGVAATGFGISPWLLALFSSAAFALGHGAQGVGGIVVTGVLGFALAAAFVLTGSLAVVVVAHYVVNALEFVVHEGLELG